MLEVFYSAHLKPYLLTLLLSREQTQIQWKGFTVFEERNGWWGFSGYEVLLQLMILSRGTMLCEVPQTTMRGAPSLKIVVAALTVEAQQFCRQPSLEADDYHLLCCCWTTFYTYSLSKARTKNIYVVGKYHHNHSQPS